MGKNKIKYKNSKHNNSNNTIQTDKQINNINIKNKQQQHKTIKLNIKNNKRTINNYKTAKEQKHIPTK